MALLGIVLASADGTVRAGEPVAPFSEEALARGVNFSINASHAFAAFGAGAGFIDLDQDGDADLVAVGRPTGVIGIYENDGSGHFIERSSAGGAPFVHPHASGVCAADYDGDGDLDPYISNWLEPNLLLRNEGGFVFTDVAAATGVDDPGAGAGCGWGDYDGDGWLDLYVANRTLTDGSTIPNRLFHNLGGAVFEEVAEALGVDGGQSPSFQGFYFDYDLDGDADLYLSNDKGYALGITNHLYQNNGGTFLDVSAASGTDVSIDSMGVACGDFDNDGFFDLYCTNTVAGNVLLMDHGDGTFSDETAAAQVGSFAVGWGAMFFDYDHDSIQELLVCNSTAPDRLYDHDGAWPAANIAAAAGVAYAGPSWCCASADIDRDGDPDLLVQNLDRLRLYINHAGGAGRWVRFDVRGVWPNRFAVGAIVEIESGGLHQIREVAAGRHYKTQDEMPVHFGLDQALLIDLVTVAWPGGATRSLHSLAVDATWTIYHPDLLYDGDQDGDVEVDDFLDFAACVTGPGPGALSSGCEMMDGDGDGDVDGDDLDGFIAVYEDVLADCNSNSVIDLADIIEGTAADANANAIPDECEEAGDVTGDGAVDVADLVSVILHWGPCPQPPALCLGDCTLDSVVDVRDLVTVVLGWGP